jgi:acetoin utilization deacetylase AcuC-like enzyme
MGDLLGGCDLIPDFFHAMTRATLEVVGPNTPVVCALEGGYNISILPDCMETVTLGMINCPYRYHTSGSDLGAVPLWNHHY